MSPWLFAVPSQILRNGATKWAQAYGRNFPKLAGRPTIQRKHHAQSVWITCELFKFLPVFDEASGAIIGQRLRVGTAKFPVGEIAYTAHRPHEAPAVITLSGKWFVSFCNQDDIPVPSEQDIAAELQTWEEAA
ncbi:hypothetical protein QU481_23380 [Crenobacter sp. SG2303]|uniref:ASCH domain-containing protein n=1 Tax=Crenobacter oryzisoli TaxID=3056844 RepID=A0ABT7XVB9_9NEIS|nr:hypothetical protein [Crenobacter sp. SG2303]MDN0077749.1 hypothetical protein [Crenobacter sp. SG2303]